MLTHLLPSINHQWSVVKLCMLLSPAAIVLDLLPAHGFVAEPCPTGSSSLQYAPAGTQSGQLEQNGRVNLSHVESVGMSAAQAVAGTAALRGGNRTVILASMPAVVLAFPADIALESYGLLGRSSGPSLFGNVVQVSAGSVAGRRTLLAVGPLRQLSTVVILWGC